MDAITMLKNDHKAVEKLFKQFEKAGDRAFVTKRDLVDRIIEELSKHAAIEEQLFYPVTRETVPETTDRVLESLEEHHIVKWVLSELEGMEPEDARFNAKVTVLIENVRHHVKEEEGDYFGTVREELGRKALNELGDAMEAAKAIAPTHPHPESPDTPPGNLVAGTVAGVTDRVGDTMSGLAQGGVDVLGDLVDRVRGRKPRRPSPKGTTSARSTASDVRDAAGEAVDRAAEAVRRAKDTGEDMAKSAKAETKRTATKARKGAKSTAKTARTGAKKVARTAKRSTASR